MKKCLRIKINILIDKKKKNKFNYEKKNNKRMIKYEDL